MSELTLEDYKAKYEYFKLKCRRLQEELNNAHEQLRELRNKSNPQKPLPDPDSVKPVSDYNRPPSQNMSGVVRGRKRKQLPGRTCEQCSAFYEAAGLGAELVQKCTRHRGVQQPRPVTPPGFWNPTWISPEKKT